MPPEERDAKFRTLAYLFTDELVAEGFFVEKNQLNAHDTLQELRQLLARRIYDTSIAVLEYGLGVSKLTAQELLKQMDDITEWPKNEE